MIVVDANVLVYHWAGGSGAPLAEAILQRDSHWVAPVLWRSEFRNAIVRLVRARRVTWDRAPSIAREAELQMSGREYAVESHAVLALAERSACTAYDCEYVALADALSAPLVTFDDEVVRAFPARAMSPEHFLRA